MIPKAEENGYRAIVITCDHPTDRVRDRMTPLFQEAAKTIDPDIMKGIAIPNMKSPAMTIKKIFSTGSTTWANVDSIRKLTKLPIICKGILSPIDAELAIKHGANGIIVRFVSALIQLIEFIY
jgi:isopentenyl diphosphate isomerase/L-lactate dehydrogenase-like FMN-dependent dehydrogenase